MSLKPEQIAHINIVNWFNHNYPDYADDLHHFANERKCTITEGRTLKRMGVKKGVADFHLALATKNYAGLWLELKVGSGKLSDEQRYFLARKSSRGYCALAVLGEESAKEIIKSYLNEYITNYIITIPGNGTIN